MALKGVEDLLRKYNVMTRKYKDAIAAAVYQEGIVIGNKSIKQTPVDTGRLRQSFYISPPTNIDKPGVKMGYGTDYALAVHERTDVPHKTGKAKFLEDPVNEAKRGWANRIAKRTKDNYDGGVGVGSAVGGQIDAAAAHQARQVKIKAARLANLAKARAARKSK